MISPPGATVLRFARSLDPNQSAALQDRRKSGGAKGIEPPNQIIEFGTGISLTSPHLVQPIDEEYLVLPLRMVPGGRL